MEKQRYYVTLFRKKWESAGLTVDAGSPEEAVDIVHKELDRMRESEDKDDESKLAAIEREFAGSLESEEVCKNNTHVQLSSESIDDGVADIVPPKRK
jgi:hypothetical protein